MKTKRIIAAVFAFAIAAANFSVTAFAAEELPTEAATEAVSTDITEISEAAETTAETTETTETAAETEETQVTSETEATAETTTETDEIGNLIGDSVEQDYFTLNDGNRFSITFTRKSGNETYGKGTLSIEKINNDGTLSPTTINGESSILVFTYLAKDYPVDLNTFFSANGDSITINRRIFGTSDDVFDSTNYNYDEANNNFVVEGTVSDSQEVTEQMLIDKFVAEYGEEPYNKDFGDFNGDGELDAYFYCGIAGGPTHTYFVTMNNITEVTTDHDSDFMTSPTTSYFSLNNGTKFRIYSGHRYGYLGGSLWIYIDKINSDGSFSTASVNGENNVTIFLYHGPITDISISNEFISNFNSDFSNNTYFTVTENGITLKYYDGDNESITSTNYTYDADKNAFVIGGSSSGDSSNNNSGNSGNSSNKGGTTSVNNSPATNDNFAAIPFTLSIALVASSAAVVGIKNRRKK